MRIAVILCCVAYVILAVYVNRVHDKVLDVLVAAATRLDEDKTAIGKLESELVLLRKDMDEYKQALQEIKKSADAEARWNEGLQNIMNYMGNANGQVKHDE